MPLTAFFAKSASCVHLLRLRPEVVRPGNYGWLVAFRNARIYNPEIELQDVQVRECHRPSEGGYVIKVSTKTIWYCEQFGNCLTEAVLQDIQVG